MFDPAERIRNLMESVRRYMEDYITDDTVVHIWNEGEGRIMTSRFTTSALERIQPYVESVEVYPNKEVTLKLVPSCRNLTRKQFMEDFQLIEEVKE